MLNFIVRPYKVEDLLFMGDLDLFFTKRIRATFKCNENKNSICLVAVIEEEGENYPDVLGFICGEKTTLFENLIYAGEVKEKYRRQGVFIKLLEEYEKQCLGQEIYLFHNVSLDEFYRKRGYLISDELHVSYKDLSNKES